MLSHRVLEDALKLRTPESELRMEQPECIGSLTRNGDKDELKNQKSLTPVPHSKHTSPLRSLGNTAGELRGKTPTKLENRDS